MELAFATRQLREICESEKKAVRTLGSKVAQALIRRLADLRAASDIGNLPLGEPNPHSGNFVFLLGDGHRLVISSNHVKDPVLPSGETDWAKVNRIKIEAIDGPK